MNRIYISRGYVAIYIIYMIVYSIWLQILMVHQIVKQRNYFFNQQIESGFAACDYNEHQYINAFFQFI